METSAGKWASWIQLKIRSIAGPEMNERAREVHACLGARTGAHSHARTLTCMSAYTHTWLHDHTYTYA